MLKLSGKYKEIYDLIANINTQAYNDRLLIANQVLSKNPFTGTMLSNYLHDLPPQIVPRKRLIIKLLVYYLKTLVLLLLWPVKKSLFHYLYRKKKPLTEPSVVIDTFFLIKNITHSGSYSDTYLPGLDTVLDKHHIGYSYLPLFYGSRKLSDFVRTLKTLAGQRTDIISEFDLIDARSFGHLAFDTLLYPWKVLRLAKQFKNSPNILKQYLYADLLHTIDTNSFDALCRYYQGKALSKKEHVSKLILWYENQIIDKLLLLGINSHTKSIKTYGAQLLIYGPSVLNMIVDPEEKKFSLLPDKILYNGSKYLQQESALHESAGPALRYKKIFSLTKKHEKSIILAVLPLYVDDIYNILDFIETIPSKVIIKPHPAVASESFSSKVPDNASIAHEDIYELFSHSSLIISAATGAVVEAVAVGIPVLLIKNTQRFDYALLNEGKGEIWQDASNKEEFHRAFDILQRTEEKVIHKWANYYKTHYFNEPTEENIIKAFDLDKG